MLGYDFSFIFGSASSTGRNSRRANGPEEYGHRGVVVVVELSHMRYQELDADSVEHGCSLAQDWCKHGRSIAASVWTVADNGSLKKREALISA